MREIHLGRTLGEKRRAKGVTQEELASYLGVSKASVSKWETEQSYPDILFLPQLATYFNISVDELLGYEPQMTKEDIRKLYRRLAEDFSLRPFGEVLEEIEELVRKYYSCFPLLLQLASLLMNHADLTDGPEQMKRPLELAAGLCVRVKSESGDVGLIRQANALEAGAWLALQQPERTTALLEHVNQRPDLGEDALYAAALQMQGNLPKAREVLQISLYQHLLGLLGAFPAYLMSLEQTEQFGEGIRRAEELCRVFRIEGLHPYFAAQVEFVGSYGCIQRGEREACLGHLREYARICRKVFPASLHGDDFFDAVDPWIEELDLGAAAPLMDSHFRRGLVEAVTRNPVFSPLAEEPKFRSICAQLEQLLTERECRKEPPRP